MTLLIANPENLSPSQEQVFKAFNGCSHTRYAIAKKSGIAETTITRILKGETEPCEFDKNCIVEAIEILKREGQPFKWRDHIKDARAMLETKNLDEVAKCLGKSAASVRSALQYAERRKVA